MLDTHATDLRIIESTAAHRYGATVREINESMRDPVSIDAIKRHLPGLVQIGAVCGIKAFRDGKMVTVWIAGNPNYLEQNRRVRMDAENA